MTGEIDRTQGLGSRSSVLTCPGSHSVVDRQLWLVLDPYMSEFALDRLAISRE